MPGWDTHGLPTELKARKKAGVGNSTTISDVELRNICRDFARKYIDDQRNQFKRLGGIAEWENPYITLLPEFEAKQIEVFAEMACKGYIYKGLKPVYWCPDCETALAEAEIEYAEDPCDSIYVKFHVTNDKGVLSKMGADLKNTYFVIWTTTTWTLPGNVAICVGPVSYTHLPNTILFFRLGDFYEMFFEDAKTASKELELTLTGRDCGQEERAPMCGVPYHSSESYIALSLIHI